MPPTLDAALLTGWVRAATKALERHRAEMDRINVFPVPDGDTGTNLLLTMRSAVESLRRAPRDEGAGSGEAGSPDPDRPGVTSEAQAAAVAAAMAKGALLGARGNSGVILSQVLRGVAEAVAAVATLGVVAVGAAAAAGVRERAVPAGGTVLADALARAAQLATAAVSRPREGTVLSVLASAAGAAKAAGSDRLEDVAVAAADAAARAVRATTGQLPELARAGVVDAGGLGVWLVLDSLAGLVSGRVSGVVPGPAGGHNGQLLPVAGERGAVSGCEPASDSEYEVMYLLDAPDPAPVDGLRQTLDTLGDCVAVAGDGSGTWTVHVHGNDVGALIEAGVEAGRPHHITVTRLGNRTDGAGPAARFPRPHAVLIVVRGPELAELARSAGASVLVRGSGEPVDAERLTVALTGTRARKVVLLPCDAELTPAAEQAAECARGDGQDVLVMPTASVLQGLAALAVHDPGRRSTDDAVAMAEAAAGTRTGALMVAEAEALTWVGRCDPGDVLGVVDGEIVLIAPDLAVGALWLAHRMLVGGGELVTVLLGEGVDEGLADGLVADLRRTHPEVDVIVHRGGPNAHPVELGVE